MRIIVTGAAGFIGSWVAEELVQKGHEVLAIDNLSAGLKHIPAGCAFHEMDLYDIKTSHLIKAFEPDVLYHLASNAREGASQFQPAAVTRSNLAAYVNTLEGAIAGGAKRVVLFSSMSVYGDQVPPFDETMPRKPVDVYAVNKSAMEQITEILADVHDFKYCIIRPHNCLLNGELVPYYEDGVLKLDPVEEICQKSIRGTDLNFLSMADDRDVVIAPGWVNKRSACLGEKAYEIKTFMGYKLRLTEDHDLLVWRKRWKSSTGLHKTFKVTVPVSELQVGDYLPATLRLPGGVRDIDQFDFLQWIVVQGLTDQFWITYDSIEEDLLLLKEQITLRWNYWKWHSSWKHDRLRLDDAIALGVHQKAEWIEGRQIAFKIPRFVRVTNDLLWVLGLFIAEGSMTLYNAGYNVSFGSNDEFLLAAKGILEEAFSINVRYLSPEETGRAPQLRIEAMVFFYLLEALGFPHYNNSPDKEIPDWIMNLPLVRLKYFLHGYWCGDGVHKEGRKVAETQGMWFTTTSEKLTLQLRLLLARFGLAASISKHQGKIKDKKFRKYYQIFVSSTTNDNILTWPDVEQNRTLHELSEHIGLVRVQSITEIPVTGEVYDITVPNFESFLTSYGVFVKNCFGERQSLFDKFRNVLGIFCNRIMRNEPIFVYGNGEQTRAFSYIEDSLPCYISALTLENEIVNIGGITPITINRLADLVIENFPEYPKPEIIHLPDRPKEVKHAYCTYEKSVELLDYEDTVGLVIGIRRMAVWAKSQGPQEWVDEKMPLVNEKMPTTWL